MTTILPIANRELRVSSRKRITFWIRIVAAIIAVFVGALCLSFSHYSSLPSTTAGLILFHVLTWTSLIAVLSSGLFLTSDCISEEKREGTLGLLFLTDLRGYDVVSGKLLATSLRCFYALLAIFPILGAVFLMGGITGVHFWKACLALLNALFVSLSTGLFISSLTRAWPAAFSGTLLSLLFLSGGGPLVDWGWGLFRHHGFTPYLSLASPAFAFMNANDYIRTPFWSAILINQAVAWALLIIACLVVPRSWQVRARKTDGSAAGWRYTWHYGGTARRLRLRLKLLERNAVLWLSSRERGQAFGLWALAFIGIGLICILWRYDRVGMSFWSFFGRLIILLLYLRIAAHAPRFFLEARRTGLIELLLVGPLSTKDIVTGQWRALLRGLGPPAALIVIVQVTAICLSSHAINTAMFAGSIPLLPETVVVLINASASGLTLAGNILALAWFGMWAGVTTKSPNFATLKTFLFVQAIPWILSWISFFYLNVFLAQAIAGQAMTGTPWLVQLWPSLAACWIALVSVAKDIAFVIWSRNRLLTSFRYRAVQQWTHARYLPLLPTSPAAPPPFPNPPAAPPPMPTAPPSLPPLAGPPSAPPMIQAS